MKALVLCELAGDVAALRSRLFERLGPLSLRGQARLSFAASETAGSQTRQCGIVAIGFCTRALAETFVSGWHREHETKDNSQDIATMRLLQIEPIWQNEPWPLMFP